jgi:hypothetical protein
MKNLIFLFSLIITISVSAQIDKFRAVEFVMTRYQGKEVAPPFHQAIDNYPVILNGDSGTFSIKGPKDQFFDIKNDPSGFNQTDSAITVRFNATDREGTNCYIIAVFTKLESAKHDGFFIVAYPDKSYLYFVERVK